MRMFWRQWWAACAVAAVLCMSGCGAVKGTIDVVGGAGRLTVGAAKATVDLAHGGVRVAHGGINLAKGAADLGTHAGQSVMKLTTQGFNTAGNAVRLVDQIDEAGHRARMRRITEARAANHR